MAMEPKKFNLDEIEARIKDIYKNHGEDIENNALLRFGAGIFAEMDWLCKELRKKEALLARRTAAGRREVEEEEEVAA